jgi:hypothetical protein
VTGEQGGRCPLSFCSSLEGLVRCSGRSALGSHRQQWRRKKLDFDGEKTEPQTVEAMVREWGGPLRSESTGQVRECLAHAVTATM